MRVLLVLVAVMLAGCSRGGQPGAQQPQAQGPAADPGIRAALAVVALERDPDHAVTPEQAAKILPWLGVLRDMRPEDTEAGQAIADEILAVLTAEQRAALQRVREQARERVGPPGGEGAGPPRAGPGPGPGGNPSDPARRAQFRRRIFDRAIDLLEGKVKTEKPTPGTLTS
ncbi:MAG: hypothetical protein HY334_02095 [Armatimonadetes bacterium]|nr:hypothetical protein [Armatimonadota bacterium]